MSKLDAPWLSGMKARNHLADLLPKSFRVEFRQCASDGFELRVSDRESERHVA